MKYVEEIINHDLAGLLEIKLDKHVDNRGEIWSIYEDCSILPTFVEDKITVSHKNVLRGLHGDYITGKLISCLHGEIFLAVVDFRQDSGTFLGIKTFHLTDQKPTMVYVPAGFLNGHLCLSKKCLFFYKWSEKYSGPENQISIKWDDPTLNIEWPVNNPILSARDQKALFI